MTLGHTLSIVRTDVTALMTLPSGLWNRAKIRVQNAALPVSLQCHLTNIATSCRTFEYLAIPPLMFYDLLVLSHLPQEVTVAKKFVLLDDLDGTSEAAGSCFISLNDKYVSLDLSQDHFDELEKLLETYFERGQTADMPRGGRRTPAYLITNGSIVGVASNGSNGTPPAPEPAPADVRQWAQANGIPVPERGRIPSDIVDKYKATKAAEAAEAADKAAQ